MAALDVGAQDQPKAVDPDDPTALFAKGLYGLFEPLVLELNDHIKNVFASQENLSAQLDHLTSELDRFNLTRAPPLDPHIERLQSLRRRMGALSSHLDKVYNRLEKMNRSYGNYRQQSTAPSLRNNQPTSQLRGQLATEPVSSPPLMTTIFRPQDPMALPSPYRQLGSSDTPSNDVSLASPLNTRSNDDDPTSNDYRREDQASSSSSSTSSDALQHVWAADASASTEEPQQKRQEDESASVSASAHPQDGNQSAGQADQVEEAVAEPEIEATHAVEQIEHADSEPQPADAASELAPADAASELPPADAAVEAESEEPQPVEQIEHADSEPQPAEAGTDLEVQQLDEQPAADRTEGEEAFEADTLGAASSTPEETADQSPASPPEENTTSEETS